MSESVTEGHSQAIEHTPSPAMTEKMVPQSQVDSLAGRIRHEAYEKGMADAKRNVPEPAPVQHTMTAPTVSMNSDDIRRMAQEETVKHLATLQDQVARQHQEQQAMGVLQQFDAKLSSAEQQFPGITQRALSLNLQALPNVVGLAASADNGAEIMDYIYNNPHMGTTLETTARDQGIEAARRSLANLSESMKINEKAKNVRLPNDPLTQIQPSPVNTDSGVRSVKDFRKLFR